MSADGRSLIGNELSHHQRAHLRLCYLLSVCASACLCVCVCACVCKGGAAEGGASEREEDRRETHEKMRGINSAHGVLIDITKLLSEIGRAHV